MVLFHIIATGMLAVPNIQCWSTFDFIVFEENERKALLEFNANRTTFQKIDMGEDKRESATTAFLDSIVLLTHGEKKR
jgi:hypothetical protein